ncbi:MAG: PAS domain S-box protein [bacterium]|nr:PAS domain S-box protein [bacterium]
MKKEYHVLMADDDMQIVALMRRLCETLNWKMDSASNGEDALRLIHERPHEIYIVDVKMPGPSGIHLAESILNADEAAAIIVMTGFAQIEDAVNAVRVGVFDYISKGAFDLSMIRSTLIAAADYHEKRKLSIQSEKKRSELIQNIELANKQFRSVLDMSDDLIFIIEAQTSKIIDCNMTVCQRLGYSYENLIGSKVEDIPQIKLPEDWLFLANRGLEDKSSCVEMNFTDKHGELVLAEMSLKSVGLRDGKFISAIARDVTKRREVEKKLADSEEIFRKLSLSAQDAVVIIDASGNVTFWNPSAEKIFGYNKEEILGRNLHHLLVPSHLQEDFEKGFRRFVQTGNGPVIGRVLELDAVRKDQTKVPVELSVSSMEINDQVMAISIIRDVTSRKKAEKELRDTAQKLEAETIKLNTIMNSVQEGLIVAGSQNVITDVNDYALKLIRRPKEMILEKSLDLIIKELSGIGIKPILDSMRRDILSEHQTILTKVNGMNIMLSFQALIQFGQYNGIVVSLTDVTDLLAEQELAEAATLSHSEFIAARNKEMQTPIECILEMTEILKNESLEESQNAMIDMIAECGKTLRSMIE